MCFQSQKECNLANRLSLPSAVEKQSFNYKVSNPLRKSIDYYLSSTYQYVDTSLIDFTNNSKKIVVLHHRDSGYSYASQIRDSNLESYSSLVEWLVNNEYSVVTLNMHSSTYLNSFVRSSDSVF